MSIGLFVKDHVSQYTLFSETKDVSIFHSAVITLKKYESSVSGSYEVSVHLTSITRICWSPIQFVSRILQPESLLSILSSMSWMISATILGYVNRILCPGKKKE